MTTIASFLCGARCTRHKSESKSLPAFVIEEPSPASRSILVLFPKAKGDIS